MSGGQRLSFVLAIACGLTLAACGSILLDDDRLEQFYRISSADGPQGLPEVPGTLVVGRPRVAPGLETTQIAVVTDAQALEYYADARWAEQPAVLIQSAVAETFQRSGKLKAVSVSPVGLTPDYRLQTHLTEFAARVGPDGATAEAKVTLHARIVEQPSQAVHASRTFHQQRSAETPQAADVAAAMDQATDAVLKNLLTWTLQRLDSAHRTGQ